MTKRPDLPLIMCVCGGPATRGCENAYRGGGTVDTTTGGRAYVTRTTLRPRRPHGRGSRRRDRLLRGAGPGGRGQDVRRGRVLGHGLRHSRLPHRDRHAEAARRRHPLGALELCATRLRAGFAGCHGQRAGIAQRGIRGQRPAGGCRLGSYRGLRTGRWHRRVRGRLADGLRRGRKGSSSRWPSASAEPRNARIAASRKPSRPGAGRRPCGSPASPWWSPWVAGLRTVSGRGPRPVKVVRPRCAGGAPP